MQRLKEVKILNINTTKTRKGNKRVWFLVKGKESDYSVWFELENNKIINESCDCYYESNSRFGNEKKCKHLFGCGMIVGRIK